MPFIFFYNLNSTVFILKKLLFLFLEPQILTPVFYPFPGQCDR
ncbi:hypothetical protein NEOC95_000180 [Neochlamydia sp. AcF95]|nr:hypothetical protein [Neochlamydia sp. AcF95]